MFKVPIARSDIHIHLKPSDIDILFGKEHKLTNIKNLTIPGNYACSETVRVTGPSGFIDGVVVVGPARPYSQVEVSITNALTLGIQPPVRLSGNLKDSETLKIEGPAGSIELKQGVIVAARHIHMHSKDADKLGLKSGDVVKVRVPGPRALTFENVAIKAGDDQALEMHVDFDEGHAAGIEDFQEVDLIL
ncbi:MAG: phosphate propanoyltransferase [Spirochaetales bacterium]|uniref:Phosphate propanoyltransferase n=1 Tax=Candidatus Thalassospirochaeta sargassi TaxID=3119039 RepID=A0AAJ1ID93_9SPIO|nr:phosphate propanoyltransferase [Spirochaetales bacterium]